MVHSRHPVDAHRIGKIPWRRAQQYSCLENPIDREDWRTAVYRVAKNLLRLKRLSTHRCSLEERCLEFPPELGLALLRAPQIPLAVLPVSSDKGIASLCL